jgi:hypothetical protein
MGKLSSSMDDSIREFIAAQPVFFVGSAPLAANGHINVSPKGLDTFRILTPTTVAYLDMTGSGIETIAHVKENRRIILMFCGFQGPPHIVRLHGMATVIEPHQQEFSELRSHFPDYEGARAIILVDLTRVSTSCGFGVPLLRYESGRDQLQKWTRAKGPEGIRMYRQQNNDRSIDDLPGLFEPDSDTGF